MEDFHSLADGYNLIREDAKNVSCKSINSRGLDHVFLLNLAYIELEILRFSKIVRHLKMEPAVQKL